MLTPRSRPSATTTATTAITATTAAATTAERAAGTAAGEATRAARTSTAMVQPSASTSTTSRPPPTATPATVHVGHANGQPVYLYNSPTIGDRVQTYPDGTALLVIGGDVEGDGLTWHIVRAPDGTEGYVPIDDTLP